MSLLKFFLRSAFAAGRPQIVGNQTWEDDPLRHPDVERMSLREIADLPLGLENVLSAEAKPPLAKCA
ncbi:hypothetical protein CO660_18370 [Rhizobium sp. L9]|uniref:hypothetical protein n=1 Tax=Rhizobium TaxID=379 RepID=UPI000BEA1F7E|nr:MULTISPECIES: hypothetical protein [Rhizobium]MBX5155184.1 hypothetical protein [Rhizobium lentis]MBX5180869.1 hypothetical protein [Rhizobium lentis]PDT28425.1 hypothetical protein CO660_18370 [Rhizobium sp. L9]